MGSLTFDKHVAIEITGQPPSLLEIVSLCSPASQFEILLPQHANCWDFKNVLARLAYRECFQHKKLVRVWNKQPRGLWARQSVLSLCPGPFLLLALLPNPSTYGPWLSSGSCPHIGSRLPAAPSLWPSLQSSSPVTKAGAPRHESLPHWSVKACLFHRLYRYSLKRFGLSWRRWYNISDNTVWRATALHSV